MGQDQTKPHLKNKNQNIVLYIYNFLKIKKYYRNVKKFF